MWLSTKRSLWESEAAIVGCEGLRTASGRAWEGSVLDRGDAVGREPSFRSCPVRAFEVAIEVRGEVRLSGLGRALF